MVGARGFEPPTPRSRTECSTRLSHAPTCALYRTSRALGTLSIGALPFLPVGCACRAPGRASRRIAPRGWADAVGPGPAQTGEGVGGGPILTADPAPEAELVEQVQQIGIVDFLRPGRARGAPARHRSGRAQ